MKSCYIGWAYRFFIFFLVSGDKDVFHKEKALGITALGIGSKLPMNDEFN
jgi:hypothetical protein